MQSPPGSRTMRRNALGPPYRDRGPGPFRPLGVARDNSRPFPSRPGFRGSHHEVRPLPVRVFAPGSQPGNVRQCRTPDEPQATDPASMKIAKGFKVELTLHRPQGRAGLVGQHGRRPQGSARSSPTSTASSTASPRRPSGRPRPRSRSNRSTSRSARPRACSGRSIASTSSSTRRQVRERPLPRHRHRRRRKRSTRSSSSASLNGGGEHGPHAIVLTPDGKTLYRRRAATAPS